jgi:hypothetical protein
VVTAPAATTTEPDDAEPDADAEPENEEETAVTPATTPATNVVAFSSASAEPEDEQEETPAVEDEDEDNLTPEQVGSAMADAMDGVPSTDIITQSIAGLQDDLVDCIEIADLSELRTWEMELQQMLDLVRTHIAAKAEPQEELPAAPAKKGKAKVAA